MRYAYLLLFIIATTSARADKRDQLHLRFASESLDRALERRDTAFLNRFLSPQLRYGHSNGWMETKEELKAHLYNGKLTYRSITLCGTEPSIIIEGKTGLVREEVTIDVLLDGKPLSMKLSVMQVWIFRKGEWILLGRQSTKV